MRPGARTLLRQAALVGVSFNITILEADPVVMACAPARRF